MESVRSAAPSDALNGKGKQLRDSNVTVIQVLPSERSNRRVNKVIRRVLPAASENIDVLTIPPSSRDHQVADGRLMNLHIINVRTGKIQDAIMLTTNDHEFLKPKSFLKLPGEF
jgi:hypothetical protein